MMRPLYPTRGRSHHDASKELKKRYDRPVDHAQYVGEVLAQPASSPRVIYLHVPFCTKVCSFCPFHRPDQLKRREYDQYLIDHIHRLRDFPYMQASIDAVNFGGGTPTALTPKQMERVLGELHASFDIRPGAEISVETSCTELTDEMLDVLQAGGVNRLSVGIQSFHDARRRQLGRRGSAEFAYSRVQAALKRIPDTGIDLLYNLPNEDSQELQVDLDAFLSLDAAGISFYALKLFEGTPIVSQLTPQEIASMGQIEHEYEQFMQVLKTLTDKGFEMMELTKLVRPGRDRYDYVHLRHQGGSCIAIGHGAGGNIEDYLYHNTVTHPDLSPELPVSHMGRVVLPEYRIIDQLIFDLQKGSCNLGTYSRLLQRNLPEELSPVLERLQNNQLVVVKGAAVHLTQDGLFWGFNIIDEIVRHL